MICMGDRVNTPDGDGYVEEVVLWRDRLLELTDVEAREFAEQCRRESGPDYQKEWGRVLVRIGSRARRYTLAQVKVMEGRDEVVR